MYQNKIAGADSPLYEPIKIDPLPVKNQLLETYFGTQ